MKAIDKGVLESKEEHCCALTHLSNTIRMDTDDFDVAIHRLRRADTREAIGAAVDEITVMLERMAKVSWSEMLRRQARSLSEGLAIIKQRA